MDGLNGRIGWHSDHFVQGNRFGVRRLNLINSTPIRRSHQRIRWWNDRPGHIVGLKTEIVSTPMKTKRLTDRFRHTLLTSLGLMETTVTILFDLFPFAKFTSRRKRGRIFARTCTHSSADKIHSFRIPKKNDQPARTRFEMPWRVTHAKAFV